ncbi:MAG: RHS repeat-associated core domain-containing protein [Isosphaerales bacterium]
MQLDSDGTGSTLNFSGLTSLQQAGGFYTFSSLQATHGGTVSDAKLTVLTNVDLTLDGTGSIATSQITSYTANTNQAGILSLSGGSLNLTGLNDGDGASFKVSGGASLTMPLTSYADGANYPTLFQASGTGSVLSLFNLATVTLNGATYDAVAQIQALSGGDVELPGLTQLSGGPVQLESDGTGSKLNISGLTSLQQAGGFYTFSSLQATRGGTVSDAKLTSLKDVDLTLDGKGAIATSQITSYTANTNQAGILSLSGGSLNLTGLTDGDGASFEVSGGASLSLPGVTSYTGNGATTTLEATGTGSTLTLANLASVTEGANNYAAQTQFEALAGGTVTLSALKTINTGTMVLEGDGTGSTLNVGALTSFADNGGWTYSTLQISNGGTVNDSSLASLSNVNLNVAGTGENLTLGSLTSYNTGNITVSGGATLSLPGVTSYTGNTLTTTLEATGAGSSLTLANLASVTEGANNYAAQTQFEALAGGTVTLSSLKTINTGTVVLESDGTGSVLNVGVLTSFAEANGWTYSTLQASNGGTVVDPGLSQLNGVNLIGSSTGTFTISPSLGLTISGGTITVQTGTLVDEGNLSVQAGATLNIEGGLSVNGSGILTSAPGSTIEVSGNLLGNTQNADDFNPQGTVELVSGTGTSKPPQELEAMSADLGAVQAGFVNNFAYGTIGLTSSTSVEIVDQSHNTTSSNPEAVYANELIVPSGATLNLNNLHVYVRGDQISGTVVGGTVTLVPSGGSIALNTPTPGTLSPAGAVDDWTFYATAGESITVQLNPGGSGSSPALSPLLNWGQVELLDPNNDVLASASNTSSGAIATISGFSLPASETYTIQVQAPAGHTASTGNYVLSAYNVTPNVYPLTVNQSSTGTIRSGYAIDQWTFTGAANEQVELNVISTADANVAFDLTGPSGTVFSNLQTNSGPVTLPSSGNYVLTAHGTGGQGGAYAFELDQTSVNSLTLGTPYSGTLTGSGQAQLFSVNVPSTQSLLVTLHDTSSADVNQIYAKLGSPPTQSNYSFQSSSGVSANQQLLVPSAAPGTWYFLVYSVSVPSASAFTLTASGEPVTLASEAPSKSAAGSTATLTLTGSGFDNTSSVQLVSMADTVYKATSVSLDTFTQLTATFDLSSVPQGTYSVVVTSPGGQNASLGGAFTVAPPGSANLVTNLILPSTMGFHISSTIYVVYSNTGSVAMPAPLLLLESSQPENKPLFTLNPALVVSGYWTSAIPEGYSNTVQILASGKEVPGWLEPGESVTVPVYYAGMQAPFSFDKVLNFDLRVYTQNDSTPVDWASLQASLQPPGISNQAWSAVFSGLTSQLGSTWGGYVQMLDNDASYLGRLGQTVTDVSQLWSFAVMQADGLLPTPLLDGATDLSVVVPGSLSLDFSRVYQEPIDARDTTGPLGYGWSDSWQYSLSVASDGTVTVTMPSGAERVFQPDSRGSDYFDQLGDHGTLAAGAGGTFTLQETNGQIEQFNADGTLDYIQDTTGNRITATYSGGRLATLSSTSGASLTLAHNPAGLIASVTSSDGRAVHYTYDAGQHLTSVQSYDGTVTQFTYNSGSNPADVNALTSILFPDSTSETFTYDAFGRLAETAQTGGADPLTYSYNAGQVTVTDAAGHASQFFFDQNGLVAKTIDPLGNASFATYSDQFNLASVTGPTGLTSTYTHDANGNLTSSTNPLGQTTTFTYTGSDNLLAGYTDANGDSTNYHYDANGNLTSTKYADNSVASVTYDALGDPLSLTNPNGQVVTYTYNAAGQVATETLAGGSTLSYAYDAHGNMITATGASGITTLTYDSGERLTSVAYPNGLSIQYTYDASGRRIQMVEKSGATVSNTVNYAYNTLGQLARLTDGIGALVISYTYNNLGQLILENKGDGTSTTYVYDADGNVLHLVNYAADGITVDSRFDYTYNTLGEDTSMATIDGTWTYAYDTTGQLVHAVFASTNPAIANQDLTYVYDAVGNRVQTIINGVTTNYTSNSVNEYTSVGGTTYKYDADGNLISQTDSTGTTTYSYDSLNRLVSVTSPSDSWIYEYDAVGNRVATIHNGQTTNNLVDPTGLGNVVGQYSGSGSLIASYTYGLGLVSQVTPTGTNYYNFDALGSTVGLTNAASGLVASYSYLPFGGLLSSTGSVANPFTFVGQLGISTDGSGLNDMRERSYDPSTGQFTSDDPLGLRAGDPNVRRYVANAPVSAIDPSGLVPTSSGLLITTSLNPLPADYDIHIKHFPQLEDINRDAQPQDNSPEQPEEPLKPGVPGDEWGNPPPNVALLPPDPPPGDPGCCGGGGGGSGSSGSHDPNSLLGPAGYGTQNFVADAGPFPYQIDFENSPTATAPAQQVVIADTLGTNLDLSTFQLTDIAFGDTLLTVPPDSQDYQAMVPMTYNGVTFDVLINASLNYQTRQLTVTLQSIDPSTQLPPSVLTGFLPPEDGTGRGEGYVSYFISPNPGLPTGTQIRNVADIVFDGNTPIATDQVSDEDPSKGIDPTKQALITIDATVPTSSVAALPPTENSTSFTVSWSGSDGEGSGIAYYNVYVSDGGGPFDPFQMNTTETSATFTGQPGHTYSFISIATSNTGITQPEPSTGQATTQILATPPQAVLQFDSAQFAANVTAGSAKIQIDRSGNLGATVTVVVSSPGGSDVAEFSKTISFGPNVSSQVVTIPIINDGRSGESDVDIQLALSSAGTGATLGSIHSTVMVIHDDNPPPPPPLVIVESLQVEKIKVGKGKKAKKETVLVLQFSGALNAGAADNANAYELAPVITVKATGKGKHKKPPTTKLGTPVKLASAVYTAANNEVTLTPRGTLNLTKPEELIVKAALVTDTLGRPIDGNDDGQPGGDFVATISGTRVTAGGLPLARTQRRPASIADMVDHLLARGELGELNRSIRAQREKEHVVS